MVLRIGVMLLTLLACGATSTTRADAPPMNLALPPPASPEPAVYEAWLRGRIVQLQAIAGSQADVRRPAGRGPKRVLGTAAIIVGTTLAALGLFGLPFAYDAPDSEGIRPALPFLGVAAGGLCLAGLGVYANRVVSRRVLAAEQADWIRAELRRSQQELLRVRARDAAASARLPWMLRASARLMAQ
jgi:hypothetical protein